MATERVMRHLDLEFFDGRCHPGARLTPVRTLANQLEVSTAVVHAVYRRLQEEGKIVSTVGKGTFLSPQFAAKKAPAGRLCLAISSPTDAPPHSEWGNAFVAAILKASTNGTRRVSILPFSNDVHSSEEVPRLLIDEVDEVDGLISFPISNPLWNRKVLAVYAEAGKPVIKINAPSLAHTENFVSADYMGSGLSIGHGLLKAGRRRFLFLSGLPLSHSPSSTQRVAGLNMALSDYPDAEPLRIVGVGQITEEAGYHGVRELLRQGVRPDVVCTTGDFLALGAVRALREHGIKVPEETSVVGGTGLKTNEGTLSMVTNPYEELGEAAVAMALACIANTGKSVPGVYLPMGFSPGGTTRSEEDDAILDRKKSG